MSTKKTIEFSSLKIEISIFENFHRYFFSGAFDDKVRAKEIPNAPHAHVCLDLSQIKSISSTGIREWIQLIDSFRNCQSLTFEKCSIVMVDQFNMIPESIGQASIESFYAPYFNPQTKQERICLIKYDLFAPQVTKNSAPIFSDPESGLPLEFDALEESYFAFLNRQRK